VAVELSDMPSFEFTASPECDPAILIAREICLDEQGSFAQQKLSLSADFGVEWRQLIEEVRGVTRCGPVQGDGADEAFRLFLPVMTRVYGSEEDFKNSLFQALKQAFHGYCESVESRTEESVSAHQDPLGSTNGPLKTTHGAPKRKILLKNSNVGFALDVSREDMKLSVDYGIKDGRGADLACIVLWKDVYDVTATVELKLSHSTCKKFKFDEEGSTQVPLAQAVAQAMGVWHSLARRGYCMATPDPTALSLPAIVLAAESSKRRRSNNLLCCVEVGLEIPEQLGGEFQFRVDRCVCFPPRHSAEVAAYEQALAIFIKTLRIGLSNAKTVLANEQQSKMAVSLCCSPPMHDLLMLASPIPSAKPSAAGVKISQGELYEYAGSEVTVEEWTTRISDRWSDVLLFERSPSSMVGCIIKVSCKSVHKALVDVHDSWSALERIHKTDELRTEIAKVLLACVYVAKRGLLITVMKHVYPRQETIQAARSCSGWGGPNCWKSFTELVTSVLLPMAKVGVVHNDIRFDPLKWRLCNIIVDGEDETSEFRLIDFESLVILGRAKSYHVSQNHAVSVKKFREASAHEFVFWQILWVAYLWCPMTKEENLETASCFVSRYAPGEAKFRDFDQWIDGPEDPRKNHEGVSEAIMIPSKARHPHAASAIVHPGAAVLAQDGGTHVLSTSDFCRQEAFPCDMISCPAVRFGKVVPGAAVMGLSVGPGLLSSAVQKRKKSRSSVESRTTELAKLIKMVKDDAAIEAALSIFSRVFAGYRQDIYHLEVERIHTSTQTTTVLC
jgi:hypothetical protein